MAAEPQQNALYQKTQGQNLKKWKIQKTMKKDRKWKFWSFLFDIIGVRTCCFDDNSPNMHLKDEKSAKFRLFKMMNLTKIAFLDLILPISHYFPQI